MACMKPGTVSNDFGQVKFEIVYSWASWENDHLQASDMKNHGEDCRKSSTFKFLVGSKLGKLCTNIQNNHCVVFFFKPVMFCVTEKFLSIHVHQNTSNT